MCYIFILSDCLLVTMEQFYLAGYDTTATTLTWALLYLLNNPQSVDKVYQEISHVVGE